MKLGVFSVQASVNERRKEADTAFEDNDIFSIMIRDGNWFSN
jgi:hypothetical protein